MTRPADSPTLQLTCTVDSTQLFGFTVPQPVFVQSELANTGKVPRIVNAGWQWGGAKQRVGFKGTLDVGFLFQRVSLSLSSDTG